MVTDLMSKVLLSCAEAARRISDSMDRPLPAWDRIRLRGHLAICKFCERYRRQLQFLRSALRQHPDRLAEPSSDEPGLSAESKANLTRRLSEKR